MVADLTDPYAFLKAAYANGAIIEMLLDGGEWLPHPAPNWCLPPDHYRVQQESEPDMVERLMAMTKTEKMEKALRDTRDFLAAFETDDSDSQIDNLFHRRAALLEQIDEALAD